MGAFINSVFHGLERNIRIFSGARGVRVIHPPGQRIGEHRHEWPFLMLPALGDYVECCDRGEARIIGPSAVLHPAGTYHANCIGNHGMETISIEFDPDWVESSRFSLALEQSRSWIGGPVGALARSLASKWHDASLTEANLANETGAFLRFAYAYNEGEHPNWLPEVRRLLDAETSPPTAEIARRLDLNPAWLARSYRSSTGEGLHETVRRLRVDRAIMLLRSTDAAPAVIASAAGFCDQSHMNRVFKVLAGRTPLDVRAERNLLSDFERLSN